MVQRHGRPFVESLESRQLMAFSAHVNFQPAAEPVPSGYVADAGEKYAARNGLTYGWDASITADTRVRNSALSADARYDTFIHMQRNGSRRWEMAVPNGTYNVHVVSGDADFWDGTFKISVEGTLTVSGTPTVANHWVEGTKTVKVSDGKLTVSNASGSVNNKICFIDLDQVEPPPSTKVTWVKGSPNAPMGRVEAAKIQIGSKVYFMGGYIDLYDASTRRVDIYDTSTGVWSRGTDLPADGTQTHAGVATDGKYIYWAGGQNGAKHSLDSRTTVWRYELATQIWSTFGAIPDNRFGGTLDYIESRNELHYFGGDTADRHTAMNTHWCLDLNDPAATWQDKAAMPSIGDHLGSTVIDNKVYLLGGEEDHGVTYLQHNNVYRYDPETDEYTTLASMPTASSHFEGSISYYNGKIFVLGGRLDAVNLSNQVVAYDVATDKWTSYSPMPEKRLGGVSWVYNGKFYYNGGDCYQNGQPKYSLIGTFA